MTTLHIFFRKKFALPKSRELSHAFESFSLLEKSIFIVIASIFLISTTALLWRVNNALLVEIPLQGGAIHEGIIGAPRFINPLLALSDADHDLTALIYSGLLKATPKGELVPDLAESFTVSPDGISYTFTLRENNTFHDGHPVTADDVIFTIEKIQDNRLKSPERVNWDGVGVGKIDQKTIVFTLQEPYAPFLENAAVGILPKHIWKDADPEQFSFSKFNSEPVGSGPYTVKHIKRNSSGVPVSYRLVPFANYALGEAYIAELMFSFYPNEETLIAALQDGEIQSANSIPGAIVENIKQEGRRVEKTPLPRIFGVFFNQNQAPVFARKEVRQALNEALDKEAIVRAVLHGYGIPIDSPIPPWLINTKRPAVTQGPVTGSGENESADDPDLSEKTLETHALKMPLLPGEQARKTLENAGWEKNDNGVLVKEERDETIGLEFTLATSDAPELKAVAEAVRQSWEELGARVTLQVFEASDLNQNVIRPRKYDALLFGEIVGRELDLFAFWHSSQRNDPGLNIALYANITADELLERMRTTTDPVVRVQTYEAFKKELAEDIPAVFLYAPDFIYVVPDKTNNLLLGHVTTPSERFLGIHTWYIKTESVWSFLVPTS